MSAIPIPSTPGNPADQPEAHDPSAPAAAPHDAAPEATAHVDAPVQVDTNTAVLQRHAGKFLIGLGLVCVAQYLMGENGPVFLRQELAPLLDELFIFRLSNLENTITGALFLIIAAFMIGGSLVPAQPIDADIPVAAKHPRLFSFIRRYRLSLLAAAVLAVFLFNQLNRADPSAGLFFVWLTVIALLVRAAYHYDTETGVSRSLHLDRWDVLWIAVLFIAGLVVGSYRLDSIPNNIIGDEGGFLERSRAIADGIEGRSLFDAGVYTYPLLSTYFQGAIIKFMGLSLWSWRFASVLAAALALVPFYLFVRDVFDRRLALISGIALITLPYFLAFERMGYNNSQSMLPVVCALFLVYLGARRDSLFLMALGGVAAGMGFYTYTAGQLGAVVAGTYLVYLLGEKFLVRFRRVPDEAKTLARQQLTRLLLGTGVFIVVAFIVLLPQIIYTRAAAPDKFQFKLLESLFPNVHYALDLWGPEELYRDYPPIVIGDQTFFYRPDLYARMLVRGVARTMLAFHHESLTASHFLSNPLAGQISVVFYFIGMLFILRNIRQKPFLLIALWWILGLLLLSIINTFPARYQHLVPVTPVIALFIALGITKLARFVVETLQLPALAERRGDEKPLLRRAVTYTAPAIAAVLLAVTVGTNLHGYFVKMPAEYQPDFESIMSFDAIHLTEPTNMIYITRDLTRTQWVPWLIHMVPTQAKFQSVALDTLVSNTYDLSPRQRYIFYFEQDAADEVISYLRQVLHDDVQPAAYIDGGGRVYGRSYAFTFEPVSASDFTTPPG